MLPAVFSSSKNCFAVYKFGELLTIYWNFIDHLGHCDKAA